MTEKHLIAEGTKGYELLDSGNHEKLERWGDAVLARPDTQAVWLPKDEKAWADVSAVFSWKGGKGAWEVKRPLPEPWEADFVDVTLLPRLTAFKHTGVFPEQLPNWQWSAERIKALGNPNVLNLFGYTGAASIAAAKAGANVTHVDSSKSATSWARENAARSGLAEDSVRWIVEDARSFVKREIRREAKYDGILLDPPAFGRGAKDEVWKIEEDLAPLIEHLSELLSDTPGSFLLLNGYAAGYAPVSFGQLLESVFPGADVEYGELRLQEKTGRVLPEGMYARFTR